MQVPDKNFGFYPNNKEALKWFSVEKGIIM